MSKGILIALSNPVSPESEDEFNRWYSEVHGREVLELPGFASLTRYRAQAQVVPPSDAELKFRYLALYELDDVDQAVKSLAEGASKFTMSDTVDLANAQGFTFVKISSTKD